MYLTSQHWGRQLYGALGHVPPLDFQLRGRVFTVLVFQVSITQIHCRRRFTFHTRLYRLYSFVTVYLHEFQNIFVCHP